MFGIQFYPTPREVAHKMVEPYIALIKSGGYVLDPSAGRGDLLDAAKIYASNKEGRLMAVEIDPDLQSVLIGKKYKLVGDDFLQYASHYHFDLILMNPPFANGDEHLLRAWEITPAGGNIACLLNAETIRNPHTAKRELLARIMTDNHGTVEYLGDCFATADRKTGVEIVLVRLRKPGRDRFSFNGIHTAGTMDDTVFDQAMESAPARRDLIGSLVATYDEVAVALEDYVRADLRLQSLTRDFWNGLYRSNEEMDRLNYLHRQADGPGYYNHYMDMVKRGAWNQVFQRTKMRAVMTDRVRNDWDEWQAKQGMAEFTKDNIMAFFDMILANRSEILHQCVVDVFDRMCSFDKKNKIHVEGWKTNSAYKVNRKVILPWFVEPWKGSWGTTLSVNHRKYDQMDDIDRAMCLITGKKFPEYGDTDGITTFKDSLQNCLRGANTRPGEGESEFFTFRYFLKGTVHLTFKEERLWQEFNRRAAMGKGWIGAGENF